MSAQTIENVIAESQEAAPICRSSDLLPGWGEAAWLEGRQIALFRTEAGRFYAASHHCPSLGAKVMARGILGDATIEGQRVDTIACPLHKEVYRLDTGICLNADTEALAVYEVTERDGWIWMEQGA
ncbi:nitrite reductase small subunit NirD [Glutamicibacter sp. PS]|uniref:nitrite reductase small subunit NirD n=1 Tax=Glutamicibacter TaxID=1742989 RepID=UPI002848FEB1|nr:nitrite reductase small subunit NirD [Glutamicibacter sp. PS]MDR4534277.1 nitrite reductase small subunit NirD [Glutamicibacter sp. PS]